MARPLSPRALHSRRISALALFAWLQTIVFWILGSRFNQFLGPETEPIAFYLRASWFLYLGMAGMLFSIALRAFTPLPRLGLFVAAVLSSIVTAYLLLDFNFYEAFRVHAGELTHRLALAGSTHPAISPWALPALKPFVYKVLGAEIGLAIIALQLSYSGFIVKAPGFRFASLVFLFFALDRGFAAHQAYMGKHWFAGQTEVYPLYLNVTANSALKILGPRPAYDANRRTRERPNLLLTRYNDYPGDSTGAQPNILFILVESWRRDALNAEHMPWLSSQLPLFTQARQHVSGGNSTRLGMFSLFYGINPAVADRLLHEKRGPYFFRRLLTDGYEMSVLASESLDFLGTRESVFIDVNAVIQDDLYYRPAVSDWMVYKKAYQNLVSQPVGKPFFQFVFFAATHAKYHALPTMEPYQPVATKLSVDGYLETHHDETRNRYLNALRYDDELIGRLIRKAMQRKDWDNTLVVITGDHGEEFWEHGNFTHSSAFNEEQTAVPLLIKFPHQTTMGELKHLTTHADLVPTMLHELQDSRGIHEYSDGRLLNDASPRWVIQSNWNVYSLFNGTQRLTYPGGNMNFWLPLRAEDDHGAPLPVQAFIQENRQAIETALASHRRFYP